jgi:hypothetical protein
MMNQSGRNTDENLASRLRDLAGQDRLTDYLTELLAAADRPQFDIGGAAVAPTASDDPPITYKSCQGLPPRGYPQSWILCSLHQEEPSQGFDDPWRSSVQSIACPVARASAQESASPRPRPTRRSAARSPWVPAVASPVRDEIRRDCDRGARMDWPHVARSADRRELRVPTRLVGARWRPAQTTGCPRGRSGIREGLSQELPRNHRRAPSRRVRRSLNRTDAGSWPSRGVRRSAV